MNNTAIKKMMSSTVLSLLYYFIVFRTALSRPSPQSPNTINIPNRYVQSSPPCIAAVCKDGIALLALHTNIQSEPRSSDDNDDVVDVDVTKDKEKESPSSSSSSTFPDIPLLSRNPLRIERLDDRGSVLMTCGWRVDGMMLADLGRELCSDELMRYGGGRINQKLGEKDAKKDIRVKEYYGKWLGWGLVKYLVKCEAKSSMRSLNSVGLLATIISTPSPNQYQGGGELHLVDTTGIIKCRAYAIGKHSTQLNERLMQEEFTNLNVEEGAKLLLDIVNECSTGTRFDGEGDKREERKQIERDGESNNYSAWDMPSGTCVEIAVIDSIERKVRRLRQPLLSKLKVSP